VMVLVSKMVLVSNQS